MAISGHDIEKSPPEYTLSPSKSEEAGARRKSSVTPEVLTGEIFDDRYESTQRGLKSRHAQMIGTTKDSIIWNPTSRLTEYSPRRNHRNRSLRRIRPDTRSRRSSFHPRRLHDHVLPHLVRCDGYH